ncbi:hypothetical protein C8A05DRAFT_47887 [Staphylotrichum tortipilum]|uniref:Zn(2)-C6 fungal-type domain-containing protein n=1 Tax=Staphylotrichum tortipilum TaxID=2831512 RepID=A0AAN6RPD0_9PEZI|nr:hypothetical protein C8A05DRAFT_47887 [Staphylotrichum longicolle]
MTGNGGTAAAGHHPPLHFLPVNRTGSPRQRAYHSCEPCRKRKSRCLPDADDNKKPCRRCLADGQPERCEFSDTRNSRRRLSHASPAALSGTTTTATTTATPTPIATPTAGASASPTRTEDVGAGSPSLPVYSPSSATSPPVANDRLVSLNTPSTTTSSVAYGGTASWFATVSQPTARSRILSAQLHNPADALDLLTFTATDEQEQGRSPGEGHSPNVSKNATPSVAADALLELRHPVDPEGPWDKFVLIRKGVLTKSEVIEYLDFYFNAMWALRPVVHSFYRDRSRYGLLAAEEPLLSVSLVTLASRYHVLSGSHGEIRSERIHWQAWKFLRKYLQSALWGSPYTRSPGAIAGMVLMIEWHSKAINNPVSFSEEEDGDMFSGSYGPRRGSFSSRSQVTSLTNQQRYGMSTLLESLNIVAPAYRSNKMSWMLLSTAIALAHEGGCFEYLDAQSGSGGPSGSPQEGWKQQWNQVICVFLHLADENLAMRLGLNPLLSKQSSEVIRSRYSTTFASILPDAEVWESYYDLSIETREASILLQSLKQSGLTLDNVNLLPELEHIERALVRWKRQHAACFDSSEPELLRACLDIEYHYCLMYSFAPASHALQHHHTTAPSHPYRSDYSLAVKLAALTRLADQATRASHHMLTIMVNLGAHSSVLRYFPVRCWVLIVSANLHLLKSTLTANPEVTDADPNIQLIRASIAAIRVASPDDIHMAVRYARFLEILLNASLRSSTSTTSTAEATTPHPGNIVARTGPGAEQNPLPTGGGVAAHLAAEDVEWWSRYSMMASVEGFDAAAALNLNLSLNLPGGLGPQIGRDPFQWWDGAFGMAGPGGFS